MSDAIEDSNLGRVKQLIGHGFDRSKALDMALSAYPTDDDFKPNRAIVGYLLSDGADPNYVGYSGFSAMSSLASVIKFDPIVANMLLQHRGHIDAHALYNAAWRPEAKTHLVALQWMVTHHVDVNMLSPETGQTALFGAVIGDNPDCVAFLIEHGAKTDVVARDGRTPLMDAVINHEESAISVAAARVLLDDGADPNKRGPGGMTALMYLAHLKDVVEENGRIDSGYADTTDEAVGVFLAKVLIAHGAKVGLKDMYGHTAAQLASKHGLRRLADYLNSSAAFGR